MPTVPDRPLGPAILRIAAWPIETLAPLRCDGFAARVDAWIEAGEAIDRDGATLAERLHALIPSLTDRAERRAALALKRRLHRGAKPLPGEAVARLLGSPALPPEAGDLLARMVRRQDAHAAERAAIEAAHAAELARAGAELARIARGDAFLRALCLASPSTYRQWHRAGAGEPSERSRRRLQATLHRYLMRAVGRATPNGLWAGIALEDPGMAAARPLDIRPAAAVTRVSPALAPFARALDALNRQRPWIEAVGWRVNPTLRRADPDRWVFGTVADGTWHALEVAHHPVLDWLAARAPRGACRLAEIQADLGRHAPPAVARAITEGWIEAGLLWSDAAFPAIYADTWEALDLIAASLPAPEAALWRTCRDALRRIADAIEAEIEQVAPDALRAELDAANAVAAGLLDRYGPRGPRGDVLVVDRSAPFRFALTDAFARGIDRHCRAAFAFDRFGLGAIESRIAQRRLFGHMAAGEAVPLADFLIRGLDTEPAPHGLSWEERVLPAADDQAPQARAAFACWERAIAPRFAAPSLALPADDDGGGVLLPPGSALLLVGAGGEEPVLRLGGITPEPCFFYARFSHLFGSGGPDPFRVWLDASLRAIEARAPHLRFPDLAVRNHRAPNVAARPRFSPDLLDPLDAATLRDALVSCDTAGRPVLQRAGESVGLIPSARSAAYLGGLDRFASILSGVAVGLGRPALLAPIPRLSREIAEWHHLPRLDLGATTISPERWTPPEAFGAGLVAARGAQRFILWRRFVREARLPAFVHTFQGRHQTESLLATASALGVEILAQDLAAHGPAFRLQEVHPAPDRFVVRDAEGQRYFAELAVAWAGDPAFFGGYPAA
ncbi:lantibiotic dehydratase [Methylobacterium oryzisoli]|uniref:lantibiotic dehydratase n=1 Tax=Methylobacterium oryzisoli TaxID=3385502 RepID=UPI003891D513